MFEEENPQPQPSELSANSADQKRSKQEMFPIKLDDDRAVDDKGGADGTVTETYPVVDTHLVSDEIDDTITSTFPTVKVDKASEEPDIYKTALLDKFVVWQAQLEKTVILKNADTDESNYPQTPDEKLSIWVTDILDKAVAEKVLPQETAGVMKHFVEMLVILATSKNTDNITELKPYKDSPVVKFQDFTLRLGKTIGYYEVLVRYGLGSDADFLLNFVLNMRETQHLASYRELFGKSDISGQANIQDITATQEGDEYLDVTFKAKDVQYWIKQSDKTTFFKTDETELTSFELIPPRVAEQWLEWFAHLLSIPSQRFSHLSEQSEEVLNINTLENLGYAINRWYLVVKDTPELKTVRTKEDIANVKQEKVISEAKEKQLDILKNINEARDRGVGTDAKFIFASFFQGSSEARSLYPFYQQLGK